MATKQRLNRIQNEVRRLYGIREMIACVLTDEPTPENQEKYYIADDQLDTKLDELYASSIMFWQISRPHMADLYLKYPKEHAKKKLLRKLEKNKTEEIHYQLALRRIDKIEEELQYKKKLPRNRITHLNKTLHRLRTWTNQ